MALVSWSRIFLNILSLSLSGALIGAVILLIHPLTERVFSRKWNYYIWFLVMLRLLIPAQLFPAFSQNIDVDVFYITTENNVARTDDKSGYGSMEAVEFPHGTERTGTEKSAQFPDGVADIGGVEPVRDIGEIQSLPGAGDVAKVTGEEKLLSETDDMEESMTGRDSRYGARRILWKICMEILGIIWFTGMIATFFFKMRNYRRFIAGMKRHCVPLRDENLLSIAETISDELHVRRMPLLYESAEIISPVTFGLWRSKIVLPKEENCDIKQDELILRHELVHVARKDIGYKWLYQILLCIHWFCPLFYWIGRRMEIDCELACDEAVLAGVSQEQRKWYGNMLLNIAQKKVAYCDSGFSTMFMKGKKDMKKRLNGILFYKKQTLGRFVLSLCVFGAAMVLTACGGITFSASETSDSDMSDFSAADSGTTDNSFFDVIKGAMWDASSDVMNAVANQTGEAWKVYDDDGLLVGEDKCDLWSAYNYSGGDKEIRGSSMAINGSDSLKILYAETDTDIRINSSFKLADGKFKVVHIDPDGNVATINDTGVSTSLAVTMKKGRNVIKMAGQGAKLKSLWVSFSGLDEKLFSHIYYSEWDERKGQIIEKVKAGETVEKEQVMEVIVYMEAAEVSEAFSVLLKQGVSFDKEELCDFLIYGDRSAGAYLVEAVKDGSIAPPDVKILKELTPYLEGTAIVELLNALPGEDFLGALKETMFYLSDKELEECLLTYLEEGGELSYAQFHELEYYLSEDTIRKLDEAGR
ncbi:MAG: M56 family metallopeptidase [Blautia sp.]|nr:M56 family metallopeptidase [Lachnoclostridium sp.]MCM1212701.1 M56 family metallopeptidase [Blautia sp.]